MRKYLLHVLIISFVFFLTPTTQAASDVETTIDEDKQAAKENPDDATVYFDRGVDYLKSGMYKEAIESCKQAIRIDPDYAQAHLVVGGSYAFLNDVDSALEHYKILKDLNPELANNLFNYIKQYTTSSK